MKKRLFLLLSMTLLLSQSLLADRGLKLKQMKDEQRVALIIGNNNYKNLATLKNPLNDARSMKDALQSRGFEVIYGENVSNAEMRKLVKKFSKKISKGGIGLYYFAGHGINIEGRNYLVGTDALMDDKDEVAFQNIGLDYVTTKMRNAKNRLNIVVLDACRNDPFSRGSNGGLAPISNAKGIFVAYATEAGSVASDGRDGKNGVFTKYLIKHMSTPGSDIAKVFKDVRKSVLRETKERQSPGVYDQTVGDFYFTLPDTFTEESSGKYTFNVKADPVDAKVEILNSKIVYKPNIILPSGNYSVKVSKKGYQDRKGMINLKNNLTISITLRKQNMQQGFEEKTSQADAAPFLKRFDKNDDDRLEKDELPKSLQAKFSTLDKDDSGYIDSSEIAKVLKNKPKRVVSNDSGSDTENNYAIEEFFPDDIQEKRTFNSRRETTARDDRRIQRDPPPPPPRHDGRRPPPPPRR